MNELLRGGNCYDHHGRYLLGYLRDLKPGPNEVIVHGIVTNQIDGKPMGHCWIEDKTNVQDYSNDRAISMPKDLYYAIDQYTSYLLTPTIY